MGTTRKNKKSNKLEEEINGSTVLDISKKKQSKRKHENDSLKSTEAEKVQKISKKKKNAAVIEQPQEILTKGLKKKKTKPSNEETKGSSFAEEKESIEQPETNSKKNRAKRNRADESSKSTEVEEKLSKKEKNATEIEQPQEILTKKSKKKKNTDTDKSKKGVNFAADVVDNEVKASETPKKRKKVDDDSQLPTEEELAQINRPENVKNIDSKRAKKREKYEKLLQENKIKTTVELQEKALNYLSRWKHNKSEWKFEKLRQIWIQNHMFDSASIPDEFWDDVLKYFGGSVGKVRQVLIEDCMKIIDVEKEEKTPDEEIKYTRARALCQYLQS